MAKRNIAVMDFGTSNITVLIGDRGVNGTFNVRAYSQANYAGFLNGEILDIDNLQDTLVSVVNNAQNIAGCKITHLYIGVPAEFSVSKVQNVEKFYEKKKKIGDRDIDEMFTLADEFSSSPTHSVINRSPICFQIDSGEQLIDPTGQVSQSLNATLSFILAEKSFTSLIFRMLSPLNIPVIEFISEPLAEGLYLIEPNERDNSTVLVDCGYLSTSVSVIVGDGLVCLKSFSLGGGHIVADLMDYLQIPFKVAEELKKYAVLAGQPNENEKITITVDNQEYQFDSLAVYEIVQRKIRQIAKMIDKCLQTCIYKRPDDIHINLTGGGVSYIKGVGDALKSYLGKEVVIIKPKVAQMNEPKNSAVLSLLELALKQNFTSYSLFMKIFKK